jgi:alpha-ribazole phosphatase
MNIILVRHGETAWNKEVIFRGRIDIPLNNTGFAQADRVAHKLMHFKIREVITSPLMRARATAEAIAKLQGINCTTEEDLIDISCGKWEGMPLKDVELQYPYEIELWKTRPHEFTMPGGESLEDVKSRVKSVLHRVIKEEDESNVVMVSHRVVLKVMICALLGLDNSHFWNIKIDNCAITMFQYIEETFILISHNDTCHLSGMGGILSDF